MDYIEIKDLEKLYGQNKVLDGINISIPKGKLISFLGPSGCGKSTLLRCVAGLEKVSGGRIFLDGVDITDIAIQQRDVGMVFQHYSLFPNLTVAENIGFGLKIKHVETRIIKKEVDYILEMVGLQHKKDQYPAFLSGGEQQRVALARALIMKPKVLLLDEPLSALDALLRRTLQTEIRRIQRQLRITTLFVTHDQNEAMAISDLIYLVNRGRIERFGPPIEIYTSPQTEFAARFIGSYNLLSSADFFSLTQCRMDATYVAFRPEIVKIFSSDIDDNFYYFTAAVTDISVHGNFIRYKLMSANIEVLMDSLCDLDVSLVTDASYTFRLRKEDVLMIQGEV